MAEDLPRDAVTRCLRDHFGCVFGAMSAEFQVVARKDKWTVLWVRGEQIPWLAVQGALRMLGIPEVELRQRCFAGEDGQAGI